MSTDWFELLNTETPAHLGPDRRAGTWSESEILARLVSLEEAEPAARRRSVVIRALVLLWHDHWNAAHELVQSDPSADAALVHAIVHRREPDPWNSKYWWRRTGAHPALERLGLEAGAVLERHGTAGWARRLLPGGRWDPYAFVDLCTELQGREESAEGQAARALQRAEFEAVLATFVGGAGSGRQD
ncbi:MAG: hypothetical protein N2438_11675 [Limisphaera sp.]|nr:hypothetical protein [Limisphaera sp.]